MRRILKWTVVTILGLAAIGFLAFLYFIPPFFVAAPETFSKPMIDAAPGVDEIVDPAQRLLAERGRYVVVANGCIGCHQVPTPQGPDLEHYLAGGSRFHNAAGTFIARNLTPDTASGLASRTDDEVKRIIKSGVFPDGRVDSYRLMPWGAFGNLTDEDIHAVVVYLRHLKPVHHRIPDPVPGSTPMTTPGAIEEVFGGRDYGGSIR